MAENKFLSLFEQLMTFDFFSILSSLNQTSARKLEPYE